MLKPSLKNNIQGKLTKLESSLLLLGGQGRDCLYYLLAVDEGLEARAVDGPGDDDDGVPEPWNCSKTSSARSDTSLQELQSI